MSIEEKDHGAFDHAIVEDNGEYPIQSVRRAFDAHDSIRLNESQVEAIREYDRAVVRTEMGRKVVVEIVPDVKENQPVEIRYSKKEDNRE